MSMSFDKTMMVKVLITGSSGFLGQHLLHSLLSNYKDSSQQQKLEIYATYGGSVESFPESVHASFGSESKGIISHIDKLDLTNKNAIQAYFQSKGPFHICLHLAAMSSPKLCQQDPDKARALNSPTFLFDAFFTQPQLADTTTPPLLVALSTDQVYDGRQAPYANNAPPNPLNVYSQTKTEMERYLAKSFPSHRHCCLRSSIICGPEAPFGNAHKTFLHFCATRDGQSTTFYTDERRSVIAVTDVVQILTHFVRSYHSYTAANNNNNNDAVPMRVYNMGGPDRVSRWDMAAAVAQQHGFSTDAWEAAEKALLPPSPVPSPLDISMDSGALEGLVGFRMKGLKEMVRETFQ